ncbi:MAG: hypothetical protein HRU35_06905 [Rickettsiaceae bacterium]|nr:hypothetical protein [Rickettsiaceae bacterium]
MNMNIYLEDQLAKKLVTFAEKLHRKKNAIVREAIKDWIDKHSRQKWPDSVLQFKGIEDFPDIEELRKDVVNSDKKLF